jgi:predicted nuclease of restriction endonuclease-like (RecB) superfamily
LSGSQYRLDIGDQELYLELPFCQLRPRGFVGIDLKIEELKPESAGKMNSFIGSRRTAPSSR